MNKTYDFCNPTRGTKVPHTPDWLHEIKYDGYLVAPGARRGPRPADYPQRLRLDQALSLDRRIRAEEPDEAFRD
jgi:hypothetical protein